MKPAREVTELLNKHPQLTHSENRKVCSHIQRNEGDWILNTLMIEGCDIPFQFKRKIAYQDLRGARVNLSYYRQVKTIAGLAFETMKVVRIRRS